MKYALWNLVEDSPGYLTGPEPRIVELGGHAESSWTNGQPQEGSDILGYVTGEFQISELAHWNYREITQAEALAFCLSINPEAYLLEDGRITAPIQE